MVPSLVESPESAVPVAVAAVVPVPVVVVGVVPPDAHSPLYHVCTAVRSAATVHAAAHVFPEPATPTEVVRASLQKQLVSAAVVAGGIHEYATSKSGPQL